MNSQERKSLNGSARSLRVINNILTFTHGFILTAALIKPAGALYLIPAVPLTLSALLGLVCVAGSKERPMPRWTVYADLCIAMLFLGVLVPMYVYCFALCWLAGWLYLTTRTNKAGSLAMLIFWTRDILIVCFRRGARNS
jgi:hypothetical protein